MHHGAFGAFGYILEKWLLVRVVGAFAHFHIKSSKIKLHQVHFEGGRATFFEIGARALKSGKSGSPATFFVKLPKIDLKKWLTKKFALKYGQKSGKSGSRANFLQNFSPRCYLEKLKFGEKSGSKVKFFRYAAKKKW